MTNGLGGVELFDDRPQPPSNERVNAEMNRVIRGRLGYEVSETPPTEDDEPSINDRVRAALTDPPPAPRSVVVRQSW